MQKFSLPAEDDDEDGAPASITHGVDYMHEDCENLMFYYNFLTYVWQVDDLALSARAYLDDILEVSMMGEGLSIDRLQEPQFAPIIRYLQRRFRVIKVFGGEGTYAGSYQVAFERK